MSALSDFQKKLLSHQVVFEGVPLAYQLGIPKLWVEHGQLCVTFFPHKLSVRADQWEFCAPAFQITCLYPSCKIVSFANRKYEMPLANHGSQAAKIQAAGPQLHRLEELCSKALVSWVEHGNSQDILYYENTRKQTAQQLGLSALWGE